MDIKPKIPHRMPIIEEALASGKYQICPEHVPEYPNIHEPMHNPKRDEEVAKWMSSQYSFEMADGASFFCDILQNGDPSRTWGGDTSVTENEEDF